MILENQSELVILEDGEVENSVKMEIDADSHVFIMQMLSKFYSDAIGSLIRETASNALDSSKLAGTDLPIIVSLCSSSNGGYEFSVEDFGVGIDETDVAKIISKYGKSTKRDSNVQLGAFGLGFKSPMAYTTSFYFIGRKDGIERKWMMYESEEEGNKIDLLYQSETTEKNGVKVIVPIKRFDVGDFYAKIQEQLCYFENVYFNIDYNGGISNSFSIFRTEDFQVSEICNDRNMHICLGDVYYSIDWTKLGISAIHVPIGLRFGLEDGIFPTPNREAIRLSVQAKQIILDKIKKVATHLVEKYNESMKETADVGAVFNYFSNYSLNINLAGKEIDVTSLSSYSGTSVVKPKLKGIDLLDLETVYKKRQNILNEYKIHAKIGRGGKLENWSGYNSIPGIHDFDDDTIFYLVDENMPSGSSKKIRYIKWLNNKNRKEIIFLKKKWKYTLKDEKTICYKTALTLYNYPKSQWRQVIMEFQEIVEFYTKQFIPLSTIQPTQQWLDMAYPKIINVNGVTVRKVKPKGTITLKVGQELDRYTGNNCKFVSENFNVPNLIKNGKFYICGKQEHSSKLDNLYKLIDRNVKVAVVSDREYDKISKGEIHNLITFEKFMEGDCKVFKRIVTAHLINQLKDKYVNVFRYPNEVKMVFDGVAETLNSLLVYKSEHYHSYNNQIDAMMEVANKYNLFDDPIYTSYLELKDFLDRYKFIDFFIKEISRSSYDRDILLLSFYDVLKYNKIKMNPECYTWYNEKIAPPPPVVLTEEILTEAI